MTTRLFNICFNRALIILFLHIIFTNIIMLQAQNTRLPVGAIPGAIDVSPMGAATYTIPIEVVPGTMGMQPNLSIVYNSMGGIGLLGMKWSLAGLSAITRCGQFPYYDNNITAIQFNENDRFALDGDRLIQLSGGDYGAIDAEYATEMENFTRIVTYGGITGYPTAFRAYTDDGSIIEYGITYDSRQRVKASTLLNWYINKITDANGNYMTFHYDQLDGEIWIDSIKYTGNGFRPYAKVAFGYTDLPEDLGSNTYFVGGYGISQTKLLETITVFYKDTIVRKYQFNYNVNDIDERTTHLKEVILFGENDQIRLNETTIKWGDKYTSIEQQSISGLSNNFPNGKILTGDFNGDGYTDILLYDAVSVGKGWRVYLHNTLNGYPQSPSFEALNHEYLPNMIYVQDINGDGKDELVIGDKSSLYAHRFLFYSLESSPITQIGSQSVYDFHSLYFGDFDGDGSTDIAFLTFKERKIPYRITWSLIFKRGLFMQEYTDTIEIRAFNFSHTPIIKVLDINGNGKKNIQVEIGVNSTLTRETVIYEYDGSKFATIYQGAPSIPYNNLFYGDVNGDGITDAIAWGGKLLEETWKIYIGKGDGTYEPNYEMSTLNNASNHNSTAPLYPIMFADMSGNGKDDIIQGVHNNGITTFNILLSKGYVNREYKYTTMQKSVTGKYNLLENWHIGDYDGDGKLDILLKNSETDIPTNVTIIQDSDYEIIIGIKDGLEKKIELNYKHRYFLADNYPYGSRKKYFLSVADTIKVSNGINGGLNTWQYQYGEPVNSLPRRTFLGFKDFICINNQENKKDVFGFTFDDASKQILVPHKQITFYGNKKANEKKYTISVEKIPNSTRFALNYNIIEEYDSLSKTVIITCNYLDGNNKRLIKTWIRTNEFWIDSWGHYAHPGTGVWLHSETKTYTNKDIDLSTSNSYHKKNVPEKITTIQAYKIGNTQQTVEVTDTLTYNYHLSGTNKGRLNWARKGNIHGSITTTYGYDINVNNTGSYERKTISAQGVSRREKYEYDPTQRFVMKVTDPADLATNITYDPKTGNKLTKTDPNNLVITYKYDVFGSLTQVNYPDGTQTNILTNWFSDFYLPNARYTVTTTSTGNPTLKVYYDILGREVCRLEDNNYFETRYNAKGQVDSISGAFGAFNAPDIVWGAYTYDEHGRKLTEKAPYTDLSYDHTTLRKITVTDNLRNVSSSKTYDVLGRIINATDNGGEITYAYSITGSGSNTRHKTVIKIDNTAATTIESDLWSNRRSITESNAGTITSEYNGLNELVKQTDARGHIIKYKYDGLGRVTQKQFATANTTLETIDYVYYAHNSSQNGKGKIRQITTSETREDFTYDVLSRLATHTKRIDNTPYTHEYTYTTNGQLYKLKYPDNFEVIYSYTSTGKLDEIRRSSDNSLIYKVNSRNNKYHLPTRCEYGNGVVTDYTYNSHGLVTRIQTGNKITVFGGPGSELSGFDTSPVAYTIDSAILNYRYAYNDLGLMVSRSESVINHLEKYTYDNLDRLTGIISSTIREPGTFETQIFNYHKNGNIALNSNGGDYIYDGPKPHAVTQIEPVKNAITSIECAVTYNFFNQPTEIIEGRYRLVLSYNASQQRQKVERYLSTGLSNTRYYINKYYEKEILPIGGERHYHYIYGDNGVVALHINYATAGTDSMHYIHTDHLGSYCAITNAIKRTVQYNYFDPWGNYRPVSGEVHPQDTGYYDDPQRAELVITSNFPRTLRGFTGHEHYPFFKIINMNGRLYDPVIARFFSPDKYVANSSFTQDFNRYTYCRNNPLMYKDPSGDFFIFFAMAVGAMYGMYNAINTNGGFDLGKVLAGGIGGGVAGGLGAGIGASVTTSLGVGFSAGFTGGLAGGFASGFVSGTWNSWMAGNSFSTGIGDGMRTGLFTGVTAGLMNGSGSGIFAKKHQGNFWTGKGIKFDVLAPGTPPSNIEPGEGMTFSNKYASEFGLEYLEGGAGGVTDYHVGPLPDGYRQDGSLVFNSKNQRVLGTFQPFDGGSRYGEIYLYPEAFVSKEQLYLTMGHEYLHAAFWYNGMKHDPVMQGVTPAHRSIYHWEYSQAQAWNYNMRYYNQHFSNYIPHPNFPYSKFRFTTIRPIVPW